MSTYAERAGLTFKKRLGHRIDTTACKRCGDGSTHKWRGWATKDHKVVVIPDQWDEGIHYNNYKCIPDFIPEEDLFYTGTEEDDENLESAIEAGVNVNGREL